MNEHDQDRMKNLLQQALPPMEAGPKSSPDPSFEPSHDLWPTVLRRLDANPLAAQAKGVVWFDWALAGGIAAVVAAFPASIPVLLYYL